MVGRRVEADLAREVAGRGVEPQDAVANWEPHATTGGGDRAAHLFADRYRRRLRRSVGCDPLQEPFGRPSGHVGVLRDGPARAFAFGDRLDLSL